MKKLLTALAIFATFSTHAQIMLGESRYTVVKEQEASGHYVHHYDQYVLISEPDMAKLYLFDDYNICIAYVLAIYGTTKYEWQEYLNGEPEWDYSGGVYYDYSSDQKVQIEWVEELEEWSLVFTNLY